MALSDGLWRSCDPCPWSSRRQWRRHEWQPHQAASVRGRTIERRCAAAETGEKRQPAVARSTALHDARDPALRPGRVHRVPSQNSHERGRARRAERAAGDVPARSAAAAADRPRGARRPVPTRAAHPHRRRRRLLLLARARARAGRRFSRGYLPRVARVTAERVRARMPCGAGRAALAGHCGRAWRGCRRPRAHPPRGHTPASRIRCSCVELSVRGSRRCRSRPPERTGRRGCGGGGGRARERRARCEPLARRALLRGRHAPAQLVRGGTPHP